MKIGNPSPIAQEYMETGRSECCPIIDMHGHFGPFGGGYLPVHPVEKMVRSLERTGVKRLVCSSHDALFVDPVDGNAVLQAGIHEYPDLLLGYWAVNPNFPELIAQAGADFEGSRGFVGFKLLPDYHTYPLTGVRYAPVLTYAHSHRLLVLVHTWGGSAFDSPQLVAEVAEKYPDATFLMGHSGYGDWEGAVRVARDFPNVYLELTAVYAAHDFSMLPTGAGPPGPLLPCLHVNGIIEFMVAKASSKKIVFGTDMPWYSPHYAAGAVLFARIDDEARHDILHRNAERLLTPWLSPCTDDPASAHHSTKAG